MTGSHIVKRFVFSPAAEHLWLPEGWKPFAYDHFTGTVICRKWIRKEADGN